MHLGEIIFIPLLLAINPSSRLYEKVSVDSNTPSWRMATPCAELSEYIHVKTGCMYIILVINPLPIPEVQLFCILSNFPADLFRAERRTNNIYLSIIVYNLQLKFIRTII